MAEQPVTNTLNRIIDSQASKLSSIEQSLEEVARNVGVLVDIRDELKMMRTDLLNAATKNIPIQSVHELSKLHMSVIKMLCWVVGALVLWFTGLKYIAPHIFQ